MSNFPRVGIIDYGLGNLYSVVKACEFVGINTVLVTEKESLDSLDGLILPGVGAFGNAMERLREKDFINSIKDKAEKGVPLLGICLGMQLLMSFGEEFGHNEGIGLIPGKVIKFSDSQLHDLKIPQIQWNKIKINALNDCLFTDIPNNTFFYFLHSYYVIPNEKEVISATANYKGEEYCCALQKNNIFGTQYHPEKSSIQGLKIFNNFKNYILNGRK